MSEVYVGIRMPVEMRAAVESHAASQNMSMSEWIRMLIFQAMSGQVPDVPEGYTQARAMAMQLAYEAIRQALANMPQTYDQALELATRAGPGAPPRSDDEETEAPDY